MYIQDIKIGQFVRSHVRDLSNNLACYLDGSYFYHRGYIEKIDIIYNTIILNSLTINHGIVCHCRDIDKDYYGQLCWELRDIYKEHNFENGYISGSHYLEMSHTTFSVLLSETIETKVLDDNKAINCENGGLLPIIPTPFKSDLRGRFRLYLNVAINSFMPLGEVRMKVNLK